MFKIGDKIMHGQTGVCEVADICEKALIKNQKKLYYVLCPVMQPNNVIYTPVESDKVFMRPIITKQQAEDLISRIPSLVESIKDEPQTSEDYRREIATHNIDDLVSLTANIYHKKFSAKAPKKKLGFLDEKIMRKGEELLFGELSAALEIPYDKVQKYIEEKIK